MMPLSQLPCGILTEDIGLAFWGAWMEEQFRPFQSSITAEESVEWTLQKSPKSG